ncbi:MAG: SDR family oxidoreductase [Anaerolineales bacterium]|nr:SDR family oxidoreductase [Anaerolineales bacterium]
MTTIFMTGFPGFLGSELVRRLLDRYPPDVTLTCLIQQKFRDLALARIAQIENGQPDWDGRIQLIEGDITQPNLGLTATAWAELQQETLEVYHLAAVYALGVPRELALRVNVDGTRHVLDFAAGCPHLQRFQYVSTCYVSGRHAGEFRESDLQVGQSFNNFYEETKYLAEIEVQQRMQAGMPATIYRPGIVVGHSQTGETQKYDGPYYVFQWILRQPRIALMPVTGDVGHARVNLVPSDFVIDAIDVLSAQEKSVGQVYQLSDPAPLTGADILDLVAEISGKRIIQLPLPAWLAKGALKYVPGVFALIRIEPALIDYFTLPTRYLCDNTLRDLAGSGVACPPFGSYLRTLLNYMQAHPDISADAMI